MSTVCREEQQPYCHVTFYASSSLPSPPLTVLALAFPTSMLLPTAIRRFPLAISASDKGLAPSFLDYVLRPALVAGNVCWLLEWLESSDMLVGEWSSLLRPARTVIARCTIGGLLVVASSLWWLNCLCVEVRARKPDDPSQDEKSESTQGDRSSQFEFVRSTVPPFLVHRPCARVYHDAADWQVVLGIATLALLCYIEVCDSVRDVAELVNAFSSSSLNAALDAQKQKAEKQLPFSFGQVGPLVLLALHTFFATGHQSTLSSLQWKAAFLLTPRLSYPASPILVILNTFGPYLLFSLARAPARILATRADAYPEVAIGRAGRQRSRVPRGHALPLRPAVHECSGWGMASAAPHGVESVCAALYVRRHWAAS